jgi:hypothetical protein
MISQQKYWHCCKDCHSVQDCQRHPLDLPIDITSLHQFPSHTFGPRQYSSLLWGNSSIEDLGHWQSMRPERKQAVPVSQSLPL